MIIGEGISCGRPGETAPAGQQNLPCLVKGNLEYCQRLSISATLQQKGRRPKLTPLSFMKKTLQLPIYW
jgi:hypothetical protein